MIVQFSEMYCGTLSSYGPRPGETIPWHMALARGKQYRGIWPSPGGNNTVAYGPRPGETIPWHMALAWGKQYHGHLRAR
ncbi:hypothetical protein LOK49_LG02G01691 [Camellia lanceoleosa]|uniref:Uncharacterized protein n=1 Tax=Camellia lanceoleosa TaxID=1840588 RepID=A0ACC0IMC2_9ERIC|nr:hypothetical protein LOK49_LG02G01691 [Camellia lanceoleosa]